MSGSAQLILDYWFGDGLQQGWPSTERAKMWFGGDYAQDMYIRARFGIRVEEAIDGGMPEWERAWPERLALILLLDQFSRNVHRKKARAFEGDVRAQRIVLQTLALAQDEELPLVGRVFLYMPLMHAESPALQDECVLRFEHLVQHSAPDQRDRLSGFLASARQHRDIVARFGRFPHRNAVLGRRTTPEEEAFLKNGPRFGQ